MLNFIYYPVSFILWCWHEVFGFLLGPANFIGWALSIIFLVFTLRLVLLKPAIAQIRSMRKMQKFQPEIKKLQKKYANDRQRQAQEMQKLQREHGVNPLGGCLPLVLQIPVFIGLNHVLRSFRPGTTEVYFFKETDVHRYLDAKLFGAQLGDAVYGIGTLGGTPGIHWQVAPVAIPLMILASIATHFTARLSVQRQMAMGTPSTGQTAMMNKLTMYIFPLGVLVFGAGFPVGLLLYWLSNNGWTLAQQHFVFRRIDAEEEAQKETAQQNRSTLAPRPGQKPVVQRKRGAAVTTSVQDAVPDDVQDAVPVEDATPAARQGKDPRRPVKPTVPNPNGKSNGTKSTAKANGSANASSNGRATTSKPAPGAKPVRTNTRNGAAAKSPATNGAQSATRATGAAKQDSTNGQNGASSEIPGLISDRSRRKKQNRKRA